jgi:hypothetical protein
MTDAVAAFPILIPPSTVTPILFPCKLGWSNVEDIIVSVPPGCAGNVGFQIWAGGTTLYPIEPGQYFVFDDYPYVQKALQSYNAGQWAISAYNLDFYQHTLQAYFRFNYVTLSPSLSSGQPVSV